MTKTLWYGRPFRFLILHMFLQGSLAIFGGTIIAQTTSEVDSKTAVVPTNHWTIQGQLTTIDSWIVPSPLSGVVEEIVVREGDQITQGQLLARLDDSLIQAELAVAQAAKQAALLESDQRVDIEYAELTAVVRKTELQRSRQANELHAKTVSAIELERQQLLVRQAELSSEQSSNKQRTLQQHYAEKSAQVDLIQLRLSKTRIQSRLEGVVVEVTSKPGQWLNEGSPLLRVINQDRLRFESLVDLGVAKEMKVGQAVSFTIETAVGAKEVTGPITARGKLTFVSPEANAVTRQVRIMAEIDNHLQQLQPGLAGQLQLLAVQK